MTCVFTVVSLMHRSCAISTFGARNWYPAGWLSWLPGESRRTTVPVEEVQPARALA